jgi:hypothetical protein
MLESCAFDPQLAPKRLRPCHTVFNRLLTGLYIFFCFEVGVCLVVVPWKPALWTQNYFVGHYPWVSALSRNYFVRGAISGIGVADIWLAFYEIWYRIRRQRATKARG